MKLRYMIDRVAVNSGVFPVSYEAVGVWVMGYGPGVDFDAFFLDSPKAREREEDVLWVINRLVEENIRFLPEDFLEYHLQSRSAYEGVFSEIVETEDFGSLAECGRTILKSLNPS